MRSAMICLSVMLAVFLGWPLAFGEKTFSGIPAPSARTVAAAQAAIAPVPASLPAAVAEPAPAMSVPESCYKRYQRTVKACTGNGTAACRLKAADEWDMCEATGFWPE